MSYINVGLGRVEGAWLDQVFPEKHVCEKYLANWKVVFGRFRLFNIHFL